MDLELVQKAKKGCKDSFAVIVLDIKTQAYRVAFCYLKNPEDSMDAVCDAMEKAWYGIRKLKQPEFFSTWFIRIVINQCKKKLVESNKLVFMGDCRVLMEDKAEMYRQPSEIDIRIDIDKLLENLKPMDRTMIYMRYFLDYSLEEISKVMEMPLSTVKTRIYTVLRKLKANNLEGEHA